MIPCTVIDLFCYTHDHDVV